MLVVPAGVVTGATAVYRSGAPSCLPRVELEARHARRKRSHSRNSTEATPRLVKAATRLADLIGQPRPRHLAVICAPAGVCCTFSNLSLTPERVSMPAIRTTGNGCINDA